MKFLLAAFSLGFASMAFVASAETYSLWHDDPDMAAVLQDWAAFVEEGSEGAIVVTFEQVSEADLLAAVKTGEADLALIKPGQTPDTFNPFEAFQLPMTNLNQVNASQAAADYAATAEATDAFEGTKILSAWLDTLTFQMSDDIMQGNVAALLDAFLQPTTWQGSSYQLVMTAELYESLPLDQQSVLDENSGPALAEFMANALAELPREKAVIVNGQTLASLPPEAQEFLQQRVRPVFSDWIQRAEDAGYNGFEIIEQTSRLLQENSIQ